MPFDMMNPDDPYGDKKQKNKGNGQGKNGNQGNGNQGQGKGNTQGNQGNQNKNQSYGGQNVFANPWGLNTNYSGDSKPVIGVNGKTYRNAAEARAAGVAVKITQTPKMTKYDNRGYDKTQQQSLQYAALPPVFMQQEKKKEIVSNKKKILTNQPANEPWSPNFTVGWNKNQIPYEDKKIIEARKKISNRSGFIGSDREDPNVKDNYYYKNYNPFPFDDYTQLKQQKGNPLNSTGKNKNKTNPANSYPSVLLPGMSNVSIQKTPIISPDDYSKMMSDVGKFQSSAVLKGVDPNYKKVSLAYIRSMTKGNTVADVAAKYDPVWLAAYQAGDIDKKTLDNRGLIEGANYSKPGRVTENGKLYEGYGVKGSKAYDPIKELQQITSTIPKNVLKSLESNRKDGILTPEQVQTKINESALDRQLTTSKKIIPGMENYIPSANTKVDLSLQSEPSDFEKYGFTEETKEKGYTSYKGVDNADRRGNVISAQQQADKARNVFNITKQTNKPNVNTKVDLGKLGNVYNDKTSQAMQQAQYKDQITKKNELESALRVTAGDFETRSRARSTFQLADLKSGMSSDYMTEANKIRAMMGQSPITITTKRVKMNDGYNKYRYSYSADPVAIVDDYYTKKGVVDWALKNTDIQPQYAFDMDVSKLQAEKNAIIARGEKTNLKPDNPYLWVALSGVTGKYPIKIQQGTKVVSGTAYQQEGVFLKSKEDYQRVQEIDSVLNKTGAKGIFPYYDQFMSDAGKKKVEYTKYAKPLESDADKAELATVNASLAKIEKVFASQPRYRAGPDAQAQGRYNIPLNEEKNLLLGKKSELEARISNTIFDYALIPNEELTKIAEYHGELQSGSKTLSKNIYQLEEGIEALKIKSGKGTTSKLRAGMFDYKTTIPVLDSLMQKYYPIEEASKQKASQVQQLSTQKMILDGTARNKIADLVKDGVLSYGQIEPENVKQTFTSKISAIRSQAQSLDSDADKRSAILSGYIWNPNDSSSTSLARQAEMRTIQVQKQKAIELNAAANTLESDLGFVLANKQYIETIVPPIATIKGIGDAGLSRTSKYSFAGGRTLTIPKDQIPEDGKVTVQLTYSFTPNAVANLSSNVGSLGVTGMAGNPNSPGASRGEGTIVTDLPVDKDGNINLSFNLTGKKKYNYGGTLQLHDAIIYQPMNEQQKNMISATQSSLEQEQQQLSALESQKQFINDAQSFLTGRKNTFSTDKGVVASISGGRAVVTNTDEFSKFFGSLSPQVIGNVRDIYGSLSTVSNKKAVLQSSIDRLNKLTPEDIPARVTVPKAITKTVDENVRLPGASNRTNNRYRTYVVNQAEIDAANAHNQNVAKLNSDLATRSIQISALDEGLRNADTLAKFITGDVSTLEVNTGGTSKTIARRTQTGYVDVIDKTEYDKLGFSLPVLPDIKTSSFIEDLEIEVDSKQKTTDELYAKVKQLGSDYVSSTINASIDSLTQMKKKGLISLGDYRKEINRLNAEKAAADNAIANDLYFPAIDELDTDLKADADEIREGTAKNIKAGLRQQALQQSQSVSRPRIPQGSSVGSAQRIIQRPISSEPMPNMTTTLGSTGMVSKNPFLDPKY